MLRPWLFVFESTPFRFIGSHESPPAFKFFPVCIVANNSPSNLIATADKSRKEYTAAKGTSHGGRTPHLAGTVSADSV
jgi:hypothetical protein